MRKKVFSLFVIIVCALSLNAQGIAIVNGIWERSKPESVKLFKINNGVLHEVASSKVGEGGKFVLAFSVEQEGYYTIGLSATAPSNRYNFYFKPGDQLNVKVTRSSYELYGDNNSPENIEMAKWQNFIQPLDVKVFSYTKEISTYVDFFPLLEEKEAELKDFPQANTPNLAFNSSFAEYKKIDFLFEALMFVYSLRTVHPQDEDFIDFYRQINIKDFTANTAILNYPDGLSLLMKACMTTLTQDPVASQDDKKKAFQNPAAFILEKPMFDNIINPDIKAEITILFAKNSKTLAGFNDFAAKYGANIINDDQKKRWDNIRLSLIKNAAGDAATDFKFSDRNGKEIALSDFKGKVVYVDVWATWCGPCKKEFPAMKKLEEEYHANKDMVFIGVSVDESKFRQKWLDFLDKEKLPGFQLFGGDAAKEALAKPYKINGIPRFILVGKDGNLIFADAPRPSSPEIRAVLDAALQK
ncbi:MAG: TlpA family protein disulfide reductase [Prevotella sp.]|jgi:thiol-disulfide isomerase/thioredoxin|nr:TlpA family protein disulfide reductase [Prevotella sp.]